MPTVEILKTYSVVELKREIGKARIKGYSKLKKAEVLDLMMKHKEKFHHLKGKSKAPKATGGAKPAPKPKATGGTKPAPKPKAEAKPAKKEPAFLPDNVMANIKGFMNVGKDVKVRKMDAERIRDTLGQYDWYNDLDVESWYDGKGPKTEKGEFAQMERAHRAMSKAEIRVIKKTMKDKRFKTDNDVVRFWNTHENSYKAGDYRFVGFEDLMADPNLELPS